MDSKAAAPRWDIYLSYASPDRNAAEALFHALSAKARVFFDTQRLTPGVAWDVQLPEEQRHSLLTLVLVSEHTAEARYQREEIALGVELSRDRTNQHHVIPIYLRGSANDKNVPLGLRVLHAIEAREGTDWKEESQRIQSVLELHRAREEKQLPRPLLERRPIASPRLPAKIWVPAILLFAPVLFYFGGLFSHRARELLLGISREPALSYSYAELFSRGAELVVNLAWSSVFAIASGEGIERWSAPGFVAIIALLASKRLPLHHPVAPILLLTFAVVLTFATYTYGVAVSVHHVAVTALSGSTSSCEQGRSWTAEISSSICTWLRNGAQDARRVDALSGLWLYIVLAWAAVFWFARRLENFRLRSMRRTFAVKVVALTLLIYLLVLAPRSYALAAWKLRYPVVEVGERCATATEATRAIDVRGPCKLFDVSAGSAPRVLLIVGEACRDTRGRAVHSAALDAAIFDAACTPGGLDFIFGGS